MSNFSPGICNDKWIALPRQPDADHFLLHCTGGFRAARVQGDYWQIEPVYEAKEARSKGFLSFKRLQELIAMAGIRALGFEQSGWHNGQWHSSWSPIIPGQSNHSNSPALLWHRISTNLFDAERAEKLSKIQEPDIAKVGDILDDHTIVERLSQSISLSLRSMDIAIGQIAEFYFEQLVNQMYAGDVTGQRTSNTQEQNLFSHVHSFFLQLGTARDYLAALTAHRLGMNANPGKIDTMNALKNKLRSQHIGTDTILDMLISRNWLVKEADDTDRWRLSGWLKEVTDVRNEIVHRRPYGSRFAERLGWVEPINRDIGLYRYRRPILTADDTEHDLLDFLCHHYQVCTELFYHAAKASGLDASMLTLTAKDIVSVKTP